MTTNFLLTITLCLWGTVGSNAQLYSVSRGQKATLFILADSSRLWLNSGSVALLDSGLSGPAMTIYGEAYLVRKGTGPVVIKSEGAHLLTITIAGSIYISNYPEDNRSKVSLYHGQALVNFNRKRYHIIPDRSLIIENNRPRQGNGQLSYDTAFISQEIWKAGFPVINVINDLGRYFGLSVIYLRKPTDTWHLSIKKADRDLESILMMLSDDKTRFNFNIGPGQLLIY